MNKIPELNITTFTMIQEKPRSMVRVMSDIDYLVMNPKLQKEAILTGISLLKAQLNSLEKSIKDENYGIAVHITNPSINYYNDK